MALILTRLREARYTSFHATDFSHALCGLREATEVSVLVEKLIERGAVLSFVPHKIWQMMVLLLVCMAIGIGFACQVHPPAHDHAHAIPGTSHHSSSSHASLDFFCILAVLPTVVSFGSLFLGVLHATPLVVNHTLLVSLPFIPPRQATS